MMNEDLSVRAGDMRTRVQIESPSTTRDAEGGVVAGWNATVIVWADIVPMSGRELQAADKQTAEVDTEIRIRYRYGLDSTMRLVQIDTGEIYDIRSIRDLQARRRVLALGCRKRV